jgi:hypothetical protein
MAGRSDFSEQEWDTLHKGITGPALLVALSDRSLFDSFKEAGALGRHLAEARSKGSSELIRELAQERGTGFSLTTQPDDLERETLGALRDGVSILDTKAREEVDAYRAFVLAVAQSVADAAGGGEEAESETLERIRSVTAGREPT